MASTAPRTANLALFDPARSRRSWSVWEASKTILKGYLLHRVYLDRGSVRTFLVDPDSLPTSISNLAARRPSSRLL